MAWKCDESGFLEAAAAEVKYVGTEAGDKKGNAIWMDGEGGPGEWSFSIVGGQGMWVGVAEEAKFGAGYKLKGLLYGGPGNLSDGSSLVTGHWGPKFGSPANLSMKLTVDGERVRVSFSLDGVGLGTAFDIQGWNGGSLRPVVSLNSNGHGVTITSSRGGNFSKEEKIGEGIGGRWVGKDLEVQLEPQGNNVWRLGAKVANSISCTVTKTDSGYTAGPAMSTKMMPPPHLQARETAVSRIMTNLTNITREGTALKLTAGEECEVLGMGKGPEPATRDQINWLS